MTKLQYDYLIIGGGIIGLALARAIKQQHVNSTIAILEKEKDLAYHGTGRNSGVLHAGFYYTANSLKAKFTKEGNKALKEYCYANNLPVNDCKKVVIVQDEQELDSFAELVKRGKNNGVNIQVIDEKELAEIEPNAKTIQSALYSPETVTVSSSAILYQLKKDLGSQGVDFYFETPYHKKIAKHAVYAGDKIFEAGKIINASGLYADKIARDFGFSENYTIIPFKGIYLKYNGLNRPIKTNIYPVPNLKNPFLGVHFTITVDGQIKIGPTAIPAFWRENYDCKHNFKFNELLEILYMESKLFWHNSFNFRSLAYEEIKKYSPSHLIKLASRMVKNIDGASFNEWGKPGIRAQLVDKRTLELVQDFVIEGDQDSIHILNAVSPAFTCSFPFAEWIVEKYII